MGHPVHLTIDCAAKHKPSVETPQVLCIKTLVKVCEALSLSSVFPCLFNEKDRTISVQLRFVPTCRTVRSLPAKAYCASEPHGGGWSSTKTTSHLKEKPDSKLRLFTLPRVLVCNTPALYNAVLQLSEGRLPRILFALSQPRLTL